MLFLWSIIYPEGEFKYKKASWMALSGDCSKGIVIMGQGEVDLPEDWKPGTGQNAVLHAAGKQGLTYTGGGIIMQQL